MRRLGVFERKIIAAIWAVGLVTVAGAIVLGLRAVREAYQVGVNRPVGQELEAGLEARREVVLGLRASAQQTARAIANDAQLNEALQLGAHDATKDDVGAIDQALDANLARYANVRSISVRYRGRTLTKSRMNDEAQAQPEHAFEAPTFHGGATVTASFELPKTKLDAFERAGQLVDVYSRLEKNTRYVSATYLAVYIAFLFLVIIGITILAATLTERVTRRVAVIARATRRVGAGDLDLQLPVEATDEVGDLTRAFNQMVRDMKNSRERIDYLQRIGAWQEFARRLAHEIKNPLTPIQLAVQEVHRRYNGDDTAYRRTLDDAKNIVEEEVATLRRLVGEFSSFAKLPDVHLERADLNDFLEDTEKSFALSDAETSAGNEVVFERAAEPLPVRIDTMMLKRGIDNLRTNAIQALVNAGKAGKIRISCQRNGAFAEIVVDDNGPGIPADVRERVFDPYYTTKVEGTGLGLPIVKKIVLEHDGEIMCEASASGGALFRIRLPIAHDGELS